MGGVEHKYLWQGSKLVSEYYGGKELEFFYDESGNPYAFSYKASSSATPVMYYYLTNLQGDILKVIDAAGTVHASYAYDAWGNILSSSGDLADVNPLRYRGYYYDAETGLYYLQSRYYDPEICRFISADALVVTGQGLLGNNLFVYCNNNPATLFDSSGRLPMRTTNLMASDSGKNVQVRAFLAAKQVEGLSENEKYFLTPAIMTSIPIENGSMSGSIEISSAHGALKYNEAIDMTIDVGSIMGGFNVGVGGISLNYGAYLCKTSVTIGLFGEAKLELGASLGFGKEFKFTEEGLKIGFSNFIGGSIAITWDITSEEVYLRAVQNK